MKIYFIPHGESEANLLREISNRGKKHPLTPRGVRQTEALAEDFGGLPFTNIYTSPLLRARQTTRILADALDVPIEETPAWREYDCGILEGRADPTAWAIFWQVNNAWLDGDLEFCLWGGESFLNMQDRFIPFIEDITAADTGDVLFVSHGGLYRLMLPLVLENVDHQ